MLVMNTGGLKVVIIVRIWNQSSVQIQHSGLLFLLSQLRMWQTDPEVVMEAIHMLHPLQELVSWFIQSTHLQTCFLSSCQQWKNWNWKNCFLYGFQKRSNFKRKGQIFSRCWCDSLLTIIIYRSNQMWNTGSTSVMCQI